MARPSGLVRPTRVSRPARSDAPAASVRQVSDRPHPCSMANCERRVDRARWQARRTLLALGAEFREARLQVGQTQRHVASVAGLSPAEIGQIERGESPHVAYETLVVLAVVLGLAVPLRAFPDGEPVRDAAQLALLGRLWRRLPAGMRHRTEVPLAIAGDRRAWDAVLDGADWRLPVEAETRLRDVQALLRRLALKQRDANVERILLVVADTRHNRDVIRLAEAELRDAFPDTGRRVMSALAAGRPPARNGLVLL